MCVSERNVRARVGGGGTSYNVLYEQKNIHINKKYSKEKSDLRLADISDGQAFLLHGI